jgi:outer membrane scaffolding protein for murein synthesis (MipA/OmpV family)
MAKHYLLAALLSSAMHAALAQQDMTLLPDGSVDVAVGAVAGNAPARAGSKQRTSYLVPQFSAEWSNGVFVEGLALGMHMSADPLLRYGPLIALDLGAQRAGGGRSGLRPVLGAFINYTLLHGLLLHAHAFAPAGREASGVLLDMKASTQTALASHHSLAAGVGASVADGAYMQSDFGTARYRPSGGLRDMYAETRWQWQVSRKYTLSAGVRASRLLGGAAASPRTEQRTGIATSLALQYGY